MWIWASLCQTELRAVDVAGQGLNRWVWLWVHVSKKKSKEFFFFGEGRLQWTQVFQLIEEDTTNKPFKQDPIA